MSILTTKQPILFEPKNEFHRRMYLCFVEYGQWMPESPKFVLESPFMNVPLMIQSKLLNHYLNKEFKPQPIKEKYVA